jgi:hypothetical protein
MKMKMKMKLCVVFNSNNNNEKLVMKYEAVIINEKMTNEKQY